MLELYMIPDFEFIQPIGMDLKDVFCSLAGSIGGTPSARQDGIHDDIFGVDPDHCQVHEDEQHVDGGVEAAVTPLDENQTFARSEAGAKHEAAQAAEETIAVDRLQRRGQGLVFVSNADGFHINKETGRRFAPFKLGMAQAFFFLSST
jgi:hypothetical protein